MARRRVIGKILGTLLGFVFGGATGGIVGFIIGHLYDRDAALTQRLRRDQDDFIYPLGITDSLQQTTYTIGIVVLGAKLAKCDGAVSRAEIEAFRRVFRIPESRLNQIGELFDRARESSGGYEPYAARLAQVFRSSPAILENILTALFFIAIADSVGLSRGEMVFLHRIGVIFGFNEAAFGRIASKAGVYLNPPPPPPPPKREPSYDALGLSENATEIEIKKTYRALIRKNHPDKLLAQGLPADMIAQATEKVKRINAAYAKICKDRGIK